MLTGQTLKTEGQQLAFDYAGTDFKEALPSVLQQWCILIGKRSEFRFEQFREWALNSKVLPEPSTPKVWGAVPSKAAALGLIEATGKYEKAKSVKTHSHAVQVWRVL